jgi:hypothetical protein
MANEDCGVRPVRRSPGRAWGSRVKLHIILAMHQTRGQLTASRRLRGKEKTRHGGEEGAKGPEVCAQCSVLSAQCSVLRAIEWMRQKGVSSRTEKARTLLGVRRHAAMQRDHWPEKVVSGRRVLYGANQDLDGPLGGHDESDASARTKGNWNFAPWSFLTISVWSLQCSVGGIGGQWASGQWSVVKVWTEFTFPFP